MPTLPTPLAAARVPAQDWITIGGDQSPGKATIVKAPRSQGWDVRKGYAMVGATIVPTGADVPEVEVLFEFFDMNGANAPAGRILTGLRTEQQIAAWYAFAKKWLNKPVVTVAGSFQYLALSIGHPVLNNPPINITKVVFKSAEALSNDGYGLWSTRATFLEFRPPKLALPQPKQAVPPVNKPAPTASDAAQAETQRLLAQQRALAIQLNGGNQ